MRLAQPTTAARSGDLTPSTDTPTQPPPNRHIPHTAATAFTAHESRLGPALSGTRADVSAAAYRLLARARRRPVN